MPQEEFKDALLRDGAAASKVPTPPAPQLGAKQFAVKERNSRLVFK